jgi:hypothetical protein
LADQVEIPERDAATVLIFEKGLEHERRYLASMKAKGLAVVEVEAEGFDLAERTALTRESNGGKKHYPSDRSEGARISQ